MSNLDDALASAQATVTSIKAAQGDADTASKQVTSLSQQVSDLQKQVDDMKAAAGPRTVLDVTFPFPDGPFTAEQYTQAFGIKGPNTAYFANKGVVIKNKCLQVTIAPNTVGEGPVWFTPLPEALQQATVTQEMQYATGFEFGMGGKGGFGLGGTNDPAVNPPTGGAAPTNGFSCRAMWRTGGEAGSRPPGTAVAYTYHPNSARADVYGEYEFLEQSYVVGQWATRNDSLVLNTPGKVDGHLKSWFDGKPVGLDKDYEWRSKADMPINRLCFAVFRGGQGTAWATSTPGVMLFRRITVTTPR